MKKILIRIGVLLLIFVGSVAGFAYMMDDEVTVQTEDMEKATLPLVYMRYKDADMNHCMDMWNLWKRPWSGYTDADFHRQGLSIRVQTFGAKVQDIYFEVLTIDGAKVTGKYQCNGYHG